MSPSNTAPNARWALQRERGHVWALRAMGWIAMRLGRRVSRLLLPPIVFYFFVAHGSARRESRRYLGLALGRPARAADVFRHLHRFAATVLDRVYFLNDRFGAFEIDFTDITLLDDRLDRGEGGFLIGAHFGSFEAMRAAGSGKGERVAMVMYEDNARRLNATLRALAPQARLHTIALGRIDAMLGLRRWLDGGGVAGLLADRTLPGAGARSRTVVLPFLGRPAAFSDGPFRLAAMLRRPVVLMVGLYHGGRRYELRFVPLADFSGPPAGGLDQAIAAALRRYVGLLESLCRESPFNWFNFYDFWADDAAADTAVPPAAAG